jgi:choline-sulfatase
MDDQHRWDYIDVGTTGGFVDTPNIRGLAAEGTNFTHCMCNAPLCAPSRIGLATGLLPERLGALDNHAYTPRSHTTYYQRLRDHGYRVGAVGKLDLSKPDTFLGVDGARPAAYGLGFTDPLETEGKMNAGRVRTLDGPYRNFLHERGLLDAFYRDYQDRLAKRWVKGASHDSVLPTDAFHDVFIGRKAVEWIEGVREEFPWHLFVSFVGPHTPFDPPRSYAERYRNRPTPPAIKDDFQGKPAWVQHGALAMSDEEIAHTRRQYAAAITVIDDMVGEVIAALDRRGMRENTIIIFASDHGEMLGDHSRYNKDVAYEPSLRVPMIMAGPGIPEGRSSEALVELNDLNPTICELAGLPSQENIDARSFTPTLYGDAAEHREYTVAALREFRTIRTRRHKLISSSSREIELYDLDRDPDELHNLAAPPYHDSAYDEIRSDLQGKLRDRFLEGAWRR